MGKRTLTWHNDRLSPTSVSSAFMKVSLADAQLQMAIDLRAEVIESLTQKGQTPLFILLPQNLCNEVNLQFEGNR